MIFSSKLFFFNMDDELIEENLWIADLFYDANVPFRILAQKKTNVELIKQIPEDYKDKIKFVNRDSDTRNKVIDFKKKGGIFSVIGVVDQDAIFSFNCKIPLFNPEKLIRNGETLGDKVIKYGLPINSFQDVIDCLIAFEIHKDNYFRMDIDDKFSVISLNNANTYYRPENEVRIKEIFETNLKGDGVVREQRILLLLFFHLINEITQNTYFEQVNYWGTFPSANPENDDTSVSFLKEAVRVVVNGKPRNGPELLIRTKEMTAKHRSGNSRLNDKCNKDLETLIVNPKLRGKLNNQVVCIIDDYVTNGYSAEAAKHLLLAAGVKKVIFISIGKFGRKYFTTDYSIEGNVFSDNYQYVFNSEVLSESSEHYNFNNNQEILDFGRIL